MKKIDYDQETFCQKVEEDLRPIILMKMKFEEFISDYALMKTEDLWDEDYDQVVRALFFEKGTREYIITITPQGLIRASHTKYPSQLSTQLQNLIVVLYVGGGTTN